MILQMN